MRKTKRMKAMEKSKKAMKPVLKEILLAQEKGEFTINIPFDKDGNLHMVMDKIALIENPITPQFQNMLFAIAWAIMEGKTMEDIKGGKDYKKEIKKYLPDFLEMQKKEGKFIFSLFLDENADIFLSLCEQDPFLPPFPDSKHMDILRNMILVAFLTDKHEDFIPFLNNLDHKATSIAD